MFHSDASTSVKNPLSISFQILSCTGLNMLSNKRIGVLGKVGVLDEDDLSKKKRKKEIEKDENKD